MYRHLLVPVDGSALSERAVDASIELARQLGADITGFVADSLAPLSPSPAARALQADDLRDHDLLSAAQAQAVLAGFEARARAAGVAFAGLHAPVTRVDQAIVDAAEASGCDLIVMVTHGRGAFGEFLFGSQTKAVLAASRLPLLVLH